MFAQHMYTLHACVGCNICRMLKEGWRHIVSCELGDQQKKQQASKGAVEELEMDAGMPASPSGGASSQLGQHCCRSRKRLETMGTALRRKYRGDAAATSAPRLVCQPPQVRKRFLFYPLLAAGHVGRDLGLKHQRAADRGVWKQQRWARRWAYKHNARTSQSGSAHRSCF